MDYLHYDEQEGALINKIKHAMENIGQMSN